MSRPRKRRTASGERVSAKALRGAVEGSPEAKICHLISLKGIGPIGGQKTYNEAFYRSFNNRRQVGSYFGLTGTPTTVARAGASKASANPVIDVRVRLPSSWPGCGCNISPTAN